MKVNPVRLVPLDRLHANPNNPKKPLGAKFSRGLKESLARYGFSGVFNVAPNLDGSYELLDGNSRSEFLDQSGATEAPCVIHEDMAEGAPDWQARRLEFALSFDRHRKLFDEDAVSRQLADLAGKGRDARALARLSGRDDVRNLLANATRGPAQAGAAAKPAVAMKSLTLYGPAADVDAVTQLCKRLRGRLAPLVKVRQALEQADRFQDLADEAFLVALCAALNRVAADG